MAGNQTILKNVSAAVVLLATMALGGGLIWTQLISSGRPKVIYLPKEYRNAGPTPPAPNFGAGIARQGRMRTIAPRASPGPPSAADIAAFFDAVRNGNSASVQAMLSNNSGLAQSVNADGATALHIAPSAFIAQSLLESGANVDAPDGKHDDPPIRWHARDTDMSTCSVLFAHSAKLPTDIFFVCATSKALSDQDHLRQIIQADPSLLESRSRPNDILGSQATPLLVAAAWDRINAVTTLLDAGAKVDDVFAGKSGASALHLAAWNDDPALIDLLLSRGASIEAVSQSPHGTPLTWAVMRGGRNSVKALLDHGAAITGDMIDMASRGVKGTDPSLPGKPADYSAIALILADHQSAAPTTKP